jgi:hypothetical protein
VLLAGATAASSSPEDDMVQDAQTREKGTKKMGALNGRSSFSITGWSIFTNSYDAKFVVQNGKHCYVRHALMR